MSGEVSGGLVVGEVVVVGVGRGGRARDARWAFMVCAERGRMRLRM